MGAAQPAGSDERSSPLVAVGVVAAVGVLLVVLGWVVLRGDRLPAAPAAPVVEAGPGPTDDVALIGDSITEMSQDTFPAAIGDPYRLRIRGRGGYRIDQMLPYAVELGSTHPEQVVINLGTNDLLQRWPPAQSLTSLNRLLDAFTGVRCIHVVTVNEQIVVPTDPDLHDRAVALNTELRGVASSRGLDVVDWSAEVAAYDASGAPDGPITSDTVHPTELGQRRLGALYRQALDRCAR